MKKILFALTQSANPQIEEQIVKTYKDSIDDDVEYRREYYHEGILKLLSEDNYDFLLLNETFEKDNPVKFEFLDYLTDHYPKLKVLYVIGDSHRKTEYMNKLFTLGIYNVLFKEDLIIQNIVKLMNQPRSKYEFKLYADIEDVNNLNMPELVDEIDQHILEEIIQKLQNSKGANIDKIFEDVVSGLSEKQIMFLIPLLDDSIIKELYSKDNKLIKKYSKNWDKAVKVIEVEKEVIKEVEVEKIVKIEKEVLKEVTVRSDSVITFFSNSSNGKTFLSWNMAHALSSRGYKVAYLNIDTYSSANILFGIQDGKGALSDLGNCPINEIYENGYKCSENLTLYTGTFGVKSYVNNDVLSQIIINLKNDNDIVIIDSQTGLNENLLTILGYSNDIICVFDMDSSHLRLNEILLDKLENYINSKKAVAVINNAYKQSKELPGVKKYISDLNMFNKIISISNAGKTTFDYMYSNTCNYLKEDNEFKEGLDDLLQALNFKGQSTKKKGIFRLWR